LLKIGLTAVEPSVELEFDQESNEGWTFIADRTILDFLSSPDLGGWTFKFTNFSRKSRSKRGPTEVFWV
jgi:hypothetical protein